MSPFTWFRDWGDTKQPSCLTWVPSSKDSVSQAPDWYPVSNGPGMVIQGAQPVSFLLALFFKARDHF